MRDHLGTSTDGNKGCFTVTLRHQHGIYGLACALFLPLHLSLSPTFSSVSVSLIYMCAYTQTHTYTYIHVHVPVGAERDQREAERALATWARGRGAGLTLSLGWIETSLGGLGPTRGQRAGASPGVSDKKTILYITRD